MSTTIKELARIAGVSHTLVSGVLSGNSNIRLSQATRNRILKLCCEYDCRPNRIAQKLRGKDMKTVFILTRVQLTPGHSLLIKEASYRLEQNGYQVFIAQTASAEQTVRQISEIINFGCDGILSCYTHYVPLPQNKLPMVVVSDYSDIPHDIGVDRESGSYMLTQHLLEHGHRRIGLAGCGHWGVQEMLTGYRSALREYGIDEKTPWLVDFLYNENGTREILELVRRKKVTAFVCANDFIAGRLIKVFDSYGIKVPGHVALTGADAMSFADFTQVSLTTVMHQYKTIGKNAAELLLSRIAGKTESDVLPVWLKPVIHYGNSCGCKQASLSRMFGTGPAFSLEEQLEMEENWRSGQGVYC